LAEVRHVKAALSAQINKSDRNDARVGVEDAPALVVVFPLFLAAFGVGACSGPAGS
jgi:hypothetical protein